MFFAQEGFTFRNFLIDAFTIFVFIMWFWLMIVVVSDMFDATIYPDGARPYGS